MSPHQLAENRPPADVESYIEEMLSELANMAALHQHRALASMIHMAAIEASVVARRVQRLRGN